MGHPLRNIYEFCGGLDAQYVEGKGDAAYLYESRLMNNITNKRVKYYLHDWDAMGQYGHYSNNPGLKKISHFKRFWTDTVTLDKPWVTEIYMSGLYKKNGLRMAVLTDNGYIGHLGLSRHVYSRNMLDDGSNVISLNLKKINDEISINTDNCLYYAINQ